MTHQPDQLAERRCEQAADCRLWSPKDALLAALRDIEKGEIDPDMLVISYREFNPEDSREVFYRFYAAGVTTMEHAGLLSMQLARVAQL